MNKSGLTVLSLFDGIGCGRIALERAGISVKKYYASEIEDGSIKIATHNYPDIIEIGDVCNISYANGILTTENGAFDVGKIDLLIGGSPCTDFSSIGYANGMHSGGVEILSLKHYLDLKSQGAAFDGQSYLFWEYVRLLHEVRPGRFLLENVVMAKRWQAVIDEAVGMRPLHINSSLLSAQNRPRLYWTDIPGVSEPCDAGIRLDDILDRTACLRDVSSCQTVQRAFPELVAKYGYLPERFNAYNRTEVKDKACALSRGSMVTSSCATLLFIADKDGAHSVDKGVMDGRYPVLLPDGKYSLRRLNIREMERLQTLPDDYTAVSGVGLQRRGAAIGNGWTVDVIAHILSFI